MKLIISIDTEEDNWGGYHVKKPTATNISALPALQAVFDEYAIRPTYFVSYVVATDPAAAAILRDIHATGRCEIGSHCHPWNTPPVIEELGERNGMLCNLPSELQLRKLTTLHETIVERLGVVPRSFRTGRWGYSQSVARHLQSLGYIVDSSISPTVDWRPFHGPDYSYCGLVPYWFSPDKGIFDESVDGPMLEVPATIGYCQPDFERMNALFQRLKRAPLRYLRLIGILDRLGLMRRVWLSPETSTAPQMIALSKRLITDGYPVLNMVFHSPTLRAGLTPYVRTARDEKVFVGKIREYCAFAREEGLESETFATLLQAWPERVGALA